MMEEILTLCKTMGAGDDRKELLVPLIRAVTPTLERRLRKGVATADCGAAFPLAAAMLVMDALDRTGDSGVTAFTAGDVSIRTELPGSGRRAQAAYRLLAPWLEERDFAFREVRG